MFVLLVFSACLQDGGTDDARRAESEGVDSQAPPTPASAKASDEPAGEQATGANEDSMRGVVGTATPNGKWRVTEVEDASSEKGLVLTLEASSPGSTNPPYIELACQRLAVVDKTPALTAAFHWPDASFEPDVSEAYRIAEDRVVVGYVVDDDVRIGSWPSKGGNSVTVAPEDLPGVGRRFVDGRDLGILVSNGRTREARYDISDFAWALEQLPCGVSELMTAIYEARQSVVGVAVGDLSSGNGVVLGNEKDRSIVATAWRVLENVCDEETLKCEDVSVTTRLDSHEATLRAVSKRENLAILEIKGALPAARLAAEKPLPETEVVTIGMPKYWYNPRYSRGSVTYHSNCSFQSCLATNALAWPGSSGGAVINVDGEIVGIISEVRPRTHIASAIDVNAIRELLSK